MLHRNGTSPASPAVGPVETPPAGRTEFLPELPIDSGRALIYHVSRQQLGGAPLIRWVYGMLVAAALLWSLLLPAYAGAGTAAALLLVAALWLWQATEQRRGFVQFTARPVPQAVPTPLPAAAKLPVYVSGLLAVENKVRRFAGLPGFYRTFATREHALLCQVRPRRTVGVAAWPEDEIGLWYAFFRAAEVHALRSGEIAFNRRSMPGLAIDYTPSQPVGGKKRRQPRRLTLYVAFPRHEDFQAALADLTADALTIAQA